MDNEKEIPGVWDSPKRILVVLAHPDDPEFFCGGTLAMWARAGHAITYVLLTRGDKGFHDTTPEDLTSEKLVALRYDEQNNAAKVIGAQAVHFLDYKDGHVTADMETRKAVVREIRRHKPDILVTCDPANLFAMYGLNHPDHRAAGQVVIDAVFPAAGNKAFFPELLAVGFEPHMPKEIWCSLTSEPNTEIDVTETWDIKLNAILEHKSQVQEPEKLAERFKARRSEESSNEEPTYKEKFRVVRYS